MPTLKPTKKPTKASGSKHDSGRLLDPPPPRTMGSTVDLTVYRPGSTVLVDGQVEMKVVSIRIHSKDGCGVDYECGWWDEGVYRESTFDGFRVELKGNGRLGVGFK